MISSVPSSGSTVSVRVHHATAIPPKKTAQVWTTHRPLGTIDNQEVLSESFARRSDRSSGVITTMTSHTTPPQSEVVTPGMTTPFFPFLDGHNDPLLAQRLSWLVASENHTVLSRTYDPAFSYSKYSKPR
jgi:hypothetical protein